MATVGQNRVRVNFNPGGTGLVDELKLKTADLIDSCDHNRQVAFNANEGEKVRLWSLAMTAYEEAAMWAVKAATG